MSTRAIWSLLVAVGLFCFVGTAAAQDTTSQPWLHVQISGDGHDSGDSRHGDSDDGHGDSDGHHDDGDDGHRDSGSHGNNDDEHGDSDDGHGEDNGHGHDDGDSHEREDFNVSINVPLSAVEPLLSLVPHRILFDGLLDVAGHDVPVNIGAMRSLWHAVADVGDAEFLTVEGGDETVRVARTGDQIHVQMEECEEDGGETVEIQLPVVVIDALLSGDGETFNVPAAVERLSELRGDIVRVTGGDHQMRIWVDEVAHPSR